MFSSFVGAGRPKTDASSVARMRKAAAWVRLSARVVSICSPILSFNVLIRELQSLCLDVELMKKARDTFDTALAAD